MKFYYKPKEEKVAEAWKANTLTELYDAGEFNLAAATLVVDAETPEESETIRKAITNIDMWEEVESL